MEEIRRGQAALIGPAAGVEKHWLGPSHVLTIHVPAPLLENSEYAGKSGALPSLSVFGGEVLLAMLDSVLSLLGGRRASLRPGVSTHLEHALLALILRQIPRRAAAPLQPASPAVPYYVRRAERFMCANFRPGLSLEEVAEAAGVSRRTVQYGFKTYHGMTPMNFYKRLRLDEARAALEGHCQVPSLTNLASELGYANASHFTSDYREMFGETPSQTMSRRACEPGSAWT